MSYLRQPGGAVTVEWYVGQYFLLNKWPNIRLFTFVERLWSEPSKANFTRKRYCYLKRHMLGSTYLVFKNIFIVLVGAEPRIFCLDIEIWQALRKESKSIKLRAK